MPPRSKLAGFAERLLAYRKACGLSQQLLAVEVGVGVGAVGHWENGIREPSLAQLVALAKALGVTTDRLLGVRK